MENALRTPHSEDSSLLPGQACGGGGGGRFLALHNENLVVKTVRVWGPLRLWPSGVSDSSARPHSAPSNLSKPLLKYSY